MDIRKYILDETGDPIVEPNLIKWAEWMEAYRDDSRERTGIEDIIISTVFLGLNHEYDELKPPLLFETMIFGGSLDQEMKRYSTRSQALEGHLEYIERVKAALKKDPPEDKSLNFGSYPLINEAIRGAFNRYIFNHIKPGHFLSACLEGDIRAIGYADDYNCRGDVFKQIVSFMYNDLPADMWGSKENFKNHLDKRQV